MSPPSGNVPGNPNEVPTCSSSGSKWRTGAKGRTPEFQTLPVPPGMPRASKIWESAQEMTPECCFFPLWLPEIPRFPASPTQAESCWDFQPRFPSRDNSDVMDEEEFPENGAELLMERFPAGSSRRPGWSHPSPRGEFNGGVGNAENSSWPGRKGWEHPQN